MENRRSFIKKTSVATLGAVSPLPFSFFDTASKHGIVKIAVIGLGFGMVNMRKMLEAASWVHCVALCDVDQERLKEQTETLSKEFPKQADKIISYLDFKELLKNKIIDGVIIATPDHWHNYIYAEATKAGKAIYIEKPTGHTIEDCNFMIALQQKYQNIVTTGLWHISLDYFIEAFKILKTGALGDVNKVHTWITKKENTITYTLPQSIPITFNYEMWQGHAPNHPYALERIKNWRFFWDYGGGRQADWLHYLDSAFDGLIALGYERVYPRTVFSSGYKDPNTMLEAPGGQTSIFQFDNYQIVWEHQMTGMYNRGDGVAWIGTKGTLVCNRTGYEVIPNKIDNKNLIEPVKIDGAYGNQYNHMLNWAQCIKDNNPNTNSPIYKGSFVSAVAHMANISYRLGGKSLAYMPETNTFKDNDEANGYISKTYQNGWEYPTL